MKRKLPAYTGVVCLLLVLMTGCQSMRPEGGTPDNGEMEPIATQPSATDELLALLERFGRASPGELMREYEALAATPEPTRGGDALLRLALLLSQPGLPFRDDAAALRVLQVWESRQANADPTRKTFVRWLRAMLGERVRLAGSLDETGVRLREEKKRADVCKDKLEAIKSMERSLIERDKH